MVYEEGNEEDDNPPLPPAPAPKSGKAKDNEAGDSPKPKKGKSTKKAPPQDAKAGFTQKSMMSFFGKK